MSKPRLRLRKGKWWCGWRLNWPGSSPQEAYLNWAKAKSQADAEIVRKSLSR